MKENTEFRIGKDPFIYALVLPNYRSMYESEFIKRSASSLSNQGSVNRRRIVRTRRRLRPWAPWAEEQDPNRTFALSELDRKEIRLF